MLPAVSCELQQSVLCPVVFFNLAENCFPREPQILVPAKKVHLEHFGILRNYTLFERRNTKHCRNGSLNRVISFVMKGEISNRIESSLSLIENVPSCAELPKDWETEISLKAMKLVCKRANCPSSWQRIRKKVKLAILLQDKVYEHSQFVKSIRLKTFQEYLNMGLDNLSPSFKRRPRQRRRIQETNLCDSEERTIELAMTEALASAVHIIPSGSGGKIEIINHCSQSINASSRWYIIYFTNRFKFI